MQRVQPDQVNMPVFACKKLLVYPFVHPYTEQATFYMGNTNTRPCITGHPALYTLWYYVQPDQINRAVFFWYLAKSDLSIVAYSSLNWTVDK